MTDTRLNLLDFNRQGLADYFATIGEKPYRAGQLLKAIHQQGVADFDAITTFSKLLRQQLSETTVIASPEIASEQLSEDGTYKWLMRLQDGNCVETVFIPEDDRGTLCISSQVGCALNCSFCSTAQQGFNRNLTTAEVIGQVWAAVRRLSRNKGIHDRQVTNVVMMGMGEPLLNLDNVINAMDIMMDDFGYGLSKRRITLSTSGVLPALRELKTRSDVALAVSLHAPNDALRNILVPVNKKYPISELMEVCRHYFKAESRRKITFEYVLLDQINDTPELAYELITLLDGMPCMVNLIPFNPFPETQYRRSSNSRISRFRDILLEAGITTVTRKTRGDDIDAACGQLVGKVDDRTRRHLRKKPASC